MSFVSGDRFSVIAGYTLLTLITLLLLTPIVFVLTGEHRVAKEKRLRTEAGQVPISGWVSPEDFRAVKAALERAEEAMKPKLERGPQ